MTGKEQVSRNNPPADEIGALITWPRRYNLLTTIYFAGRRATLLERLAAASGAGPGDRVADIGCGPGSFAGVLAGAVGPRGEVVGVDPSAPMIEYAARHSGTLPNCRFELGAAQSLPLPDAQFDVVTSTFAMHHIAERQRNTALGEMFRVLTPGGRLMLVDAHASGGVRGSVLQFMARLAAQRSHHGHADADPLAAVDLRRYREPLRAAGFDTITFTAGSFATGILTAVKPG